MVVYHFADFTLDPTKGTLASRVRTVKLGRRIGPVFLHLIEARGRIVSYDELLKSHWGPGADDQNLVEQAVSRIRAVLGDDVRQPIFIKTVDEVGYQFIAVVEIEDRPLQPDHPTYPTKESGRVPTEGHDLEGRSGTLAIEVSSETQSQRANHAQSTSEIHSTPFRQGQSARRWRLVVVLSVGLTFILAFILRPTAPTLQVLQVTPITQTDEPKVAPLLTDGRSIYFHEQLSTGLRPVRVPIEGGDIKPLGIPLVNPELTDLSGDGQLLLRSLRRSAIELNPAFVHSLSGGEPKPVGDIEVYELNWGPDGKSIIYSTGSDVFLASPQGIVKKHLFTVVGKAYWFRYAPQLDRIRFSLLTPSTGALSIWEVGPDGTNLRPAFPGFKQNHCCGNWSADGRYYFFQSVVDSAYQVFVATERWYPFFKSLKTPAQLTSPPISHRGPLMSHDGRTLFVRATLPRGELMRYDQRSSAFTELFPRAYALGVDYSLSDMDLVYVKSPDSTLWRSDRAGRTARQLTFPPLQVAQPRWSPDGSQIAFMGLYPNSTWKVYIIASSGGSPQVISTGEENEADPDWSRDGLKLSIGRIPARLANKFDKIVVKIVDVQTAHATTLPDSEDLFAARWSPKSDRIAAVYKDGTQVKLYTFATNKWKAFDAVRSHPDWIKGAGYLNWTRDGNYLIFSAAGRQGKGIFRIDVLRAKVELVASLSSFQQASFIFGDWIGLTPEGSPIAVRNRSIDDIYALHLGTR